MKSLLFLMIMASSVFAEDIDCCKNLNMSNALLSICKSYTLRNNNYVLPENSNKQRCDNLRSNFAKHSGGLDIDSVLQGKLTKTSKVIGSSGGTVNLQDIGSVTFPAGTIDSDTAITVETTSDPAINDMFDEFTPMFKPAKRLAYELRVSTGAMPPRSEFVTVEMVLPQNFLDQMPTNYKPESFALIVQGSQDEEPFPVFDLIPSTYSPETHKISAELPGAVFSETFSSDGQYQAIMTIAPTLGQGGDLSSNKIKTLMTNNEQGNVATASTSNCKAAKIISQGP